MTIHDEIDNYLAADLHGELSEDERSELHTHLVECADCRKAHQETKLMNKILEENLANEKPDLAFERRMLAHFCNRPQQRHGLVRPIIDFMRLHPIQITAALVIVLIACGLSVDRLGNLTGFAKETAAKADAQALAAEFKLNPARSASTIALGRSEPPAARGAGKSESNEPAAEERFHNFASTQAQFPAAAASPAPVDTYRTEDVARPGVRSTTDLVQKLPAAKPANEGNEPDAELNVMPLESTSAAGALANRKLIRNAQVELEVARFDEAAQKITAFANEDKGYVATTSSEKQANGKLKGEIVVKILPENLDRFLQKVRGLGELKNQTLGTEDITKAYFDTDVRLKNARVMEQRLIDMLKKKSDDINDLLQVEKELGRVREEIEKMQGDLKYWDSQVQFATVTLSLAEKDLEEPAAFLLKERAQLALYAPEVEKVYNDIKGLASPKTQITNAQLDRDNSGRVSARVSLLIAPEESESVIKNVKAMGRVENFQVQTERVAQGGTGMSENAKTKRDKVELNITISREEQEQAFQQTSLLIRTPSVDEKAKELRALSEKQSGRVRSSSFSRDPDGHEVANVSLRVLLKNYNALMQSLNSLGKVENVSVQRQDRTGGQIDEANAPADISIQVYSQGNIVSSESGLFATMRNTLAQGAEALMWSLRMIGVAIAFLAPWVIAIVVVVWVAKRIARARR